ncbi:MAG: phosphotransferase [Chlamydiia bacterium]|nr:phosphotransferase [Chlamydiia bacterium]
MRRTLLSDRHGQRVWREMRGDKSVIVREGKTPRIGVHAAILRELEGQGISPRLIEEGEGFSVEEDLGGAVLRSAPLTIEEKVAGMVHPLKVLHGFQRSVPEFKELIFERYRPFFEQVEEEAKWLYDHFPAAGPSVLLHGSCSFNNALYSRGKVYLVDFCDSYPGPKECDLGSLFLAEFFDKRLLPEGYDRKKTFFFAALYAVKQLGKLPNAPLKRVLEERLAYLKQWYREME